jgi:hypothetical protein
MRRRWLLSIGVCAATVWGVRAGTTRSAKADPITHVIEFAGADLGGEVSKAQYRYVHSQPHHWRQLMIKN